MKTNFIIAAGLLCSLACNGQKLSVSTNLLDYANMGTVNAEASYGFSRHWSAVAGFRYNPFTFGQKGYESENRQRCLAAGIRFWPWHIFSGWWLGGKMQYQEYNAGGIRSMETTEGDRYGGGVSGGYSWMVGRHLNIDFGVGIWAGYDRFVVYECPRCGRISGGGARGFLRPNDMLLSVAYVF